MFFRKVVFELLRIKGISEKELIKKLGVGYQAWKLSVGRYFSDRPLQFQLYLTAELNVPHDFFIRIKRYEKINEGDCNEYIRKKVVVRYKNGN